MANHKKFRTQHNEQNLTMSTPTTTVIDNFWFLYQRLENPTEGQFYAIHVLKRRKDNPDMSTGCKMIYITSVYNKEDLDERKDKIISMCKENNARCYVKINQRSDKKVSECLLKYVLDNHLKGHYNLMKHAYDHCVGISESNSADVRYFLIDVDKEKTEETNKTHENSKHETIDFVVTEIEKFLNEQKALGRMKDKPIYKLPTKNGYHILTPGFDSRHKFIFAGWEISVVKDADTLLWTYG